MGSGTKSRFPLIALAILIGLILESVIVLSSGAAPYLLSNLGEESGPLFFNVLFASMPFLSLALRGIKAPLPWILGLLLMSLVYGYVAAKFVTGGFEQGSSVGNAMWLALVLIGSSIVVTGICWLLSGRLGSR